MRRARILHIEPAAPAKPPAGQACNGCGVCCLAEPCPLGVLLSGRRRGACAALRWQDDVARYVCGALTEPAGVLRARWVWPRVALWLAPALRRIARRWIGLETGCDCTLAVDVLHGGELGHNDDHD